MELSLNPEESIELLVTKKKILPLRNEDWIKIPMLLFFLFMFYFITIKNFSSKGFSEGFKAYFVFILIIAFYFLFSVIKNYYKRYVVAFKWKYLLTNKRLLILNQEDIIEHSFDYDNFPQIEFGENLHGNGYIIIGKEEPFLAESKSLISYRVGVNFSEEDLILYNIENVKKVYHLLQSKITNYNLE